MCQHHWWHHVVLCIWDLCHVVTLSTGTAVPWCQHNNVICHMVSCGIIVKQNDSLSIWICKVFLHITITVTAMGINNWVIYFLYLSKAVLKIMRTGQKHGLKPNWPVGDFTTGIKSNTGLFWDWSGIRSDICRLSSNHGWSLTNINLSLCYNLFTDNDPRLEVYCSEHSKIIC